MAYVTLDQVQPPSGASIPSGSAPQGGAGVTLDQVKPPPGWSASASSMPAKPADNAPPSPFSGHAWYDKAVQNYEKSWPYAVGRGLVTGAVGLPGDLEKLATSTIPGWLGAANPGTTTVFPTSGDVGRYLTKSGLPPSQTHPMLEGGSQFLGGLVAPMGEIAGPVEKGTAALARARTGASALDKASSGGLLPRLFGGAPERQDIGQAAQFAQKQGYKLLPSNAFGIGKATQQIADSGSGAAAKANYAKYTDVLKQTMGIPKSQELNSTALSKAAKDIPARFDSFLQGKTVTVPDSVRNTIANLVVSKPDLAQEVISDKGISATIHSLDQGEKVPASNWFKVIQKLKSARNSASKASDTAALTDVLDAAEKPFFQSDPAMARAYRTFNRQYRAVATTLKATDQDPYFLQTGRVDPQKIWRQIESDAKSPNALADIRTSKTPFLRHTRTAAQLNLTPAAERISEEPALNLGTAAMHSVGLPVHLSVSSANAIPKFLSRIGGGAALRSFYESPQGQAALMGSRPLSQAEIDTIRALQNLPGTAQGTGLLGNKRP